jgi:hypothetical protein
VLRLQGSQIGPAKQCAPVRGQYRRTREDGRGRVSAVQRHLLGQLLLAGALDVSAAPAADRPRGCLATTAAAYYRATVLGSLAPRARALPTSRDHAARAWKGADGDRAGVRQTGRLIARATRRGTLTVASLSAGSGSPCAYTKAAHVGSLQYGEGEDRPAELGGTSEVGQWPLRSRYVSGSPPRRDPHSHAALRTARHTNLVDVLQCTVK